MIFAADYVLENNKYRAKFARLCFLLNNIFTAAGVFRLPLSCHRRMGRNVKIAQLFVYPKAA